MTREIPLSKGRGIALVDDEDFVTMSANTWRPWNGYAQRQTVRSGKRVSVYMHREILGVAAGVQVDHINGDRLDNRRANLRPCTNIENQWNTGPRGNRDLPKGVWAQKPRGPKSVIKYRAGIQLGGTTVHLGTYSTVADAAQAYDAAARQHHGEFARLNQPANRPGRKTSPV